MSQTALCPKFGEGDSKGDSLDISKAETICYEIETKTTKALLVDKPIAADFSKNQTGTAAGNWQLLVRERRYFWGGGLER